MSLITDYLELTRLNKPIGILLLLWPTLSALWIAAHGLPSLHLLAVFTCGVIIMRTTGCIINDIADRNFDGAIKRTQHRPLANQRISVKSALTLCVVLLMLGLGLVLTLNRFAILLSFPALALAACYPYMKRITQLPQVVLGCSFSWGILMAFAATKNQLPIIAWVLFVANILWTIAYDTQYAMVDRDDDIIIGLKSTAILFGQYDRLAIAILQCMVVGCWITCGWLLRAHYTFWVAIIISSILFTYQQSLIKNRQRSDCFRAFLNNNWVGMVMFIGIIGH